MRKFVILAAAICWAATAAGPAEAFSPLQFKQDYYSDFNYTTLVGEYVLYCDGSDHFVGTISENSLTYDYEC